MTVETMVKEAAKGLDGLIPPKELGNHEFHQINVTVPNPRISFEPQETPVNIIDIIAGIGLALGFIALGFSLHGM